MSALADLRDAIAAAVATVDGLRATALVTDQVNPPQAMVYRKASSYDEVMHDPGDTAAGTWNFGVVVYALRTDERSAQNLLDEYAEPVGDKSVKAAVETDAALAALCDWALVTDVGDVQVRTIGTVDYLSEDFTVTVGI